MRGRGPGRRFGRWSKGCLARDGRHEGEDLIQRPWGVGEIQCLDEQARVANLAAGSAAHEAAQLLFPRPAPPGALLLQGAKRSQLTLGGNDLLNHVRAERADQLVLEVLDAHEEAEGLHGGAGETGSETCALEPAPEIVLLARVANSGQLHVEPPRAEPSQERADRLRTAHRQDGDALGFEVAAVPLGECHDCVLVADPFDEDDGAWCYEGSQSSRKGAGARCGTFAYASSALIVSRSTLAPYFRARSSTVYAPQPSVS
jgi:hypothetical protein